MSSNNPIGDAANTYRKVMINPTVNAGVHGLLAFGVGTVGWNRMIETARSLFRRPAGVFLKMTPREFDEEMEDIKNDNKLRYIIPGALGAGVIGLSLATSYRPNEEYGGLLSWNAAPKPLNMYRYRGYIMPGTQNLPKEAALKKFANALAEFGGYIPTQDIANSYANTIDSQYWQNALFSNDPNMQMDNHTRFTGEAIFADARKRDGSVYVREGTLRDSASNILKSKFSLMGVTGVAAKTMLSNFAADLFVNAVGAMTGIPQETREDLISAGTWYGAAKSILS